MRSLSKLESDSRRSGYHLAKKAILYFFKLRRGDDSVFGEPCIGFDLRRN